MRGSCFGLPYKSYAVVVFLPALTYCMASYFMLNVEMNEEVVLMVVIPLALASCDSTMDAHVFLVSPSVLRLCVGVLKECVAFIDVLVDWSYCADAASFECRSPRLEGTSHNATLPCLVYFIRPVPHHVTNRTKVWRDKTRVFTWYTI